MLLQALRSHELESFEIKEKAYAVASGAVSILVSDGLKGGRQ
jgi:hypothetical protein